MPVKPLEESSEKYEASIKPFINSLFSKGARSKKIVIAAANAGDDTVSFVDDVSRKIIMNSWLAAWKSVATDADDASKAWEPYIRSADYSIIQFLAGYIARHQLSLCVRPIELSSTSIDPAAFGVPFYRRSDYVRYPFVIDKHFDWGTLDDTGKPAEEGAVVRFLWLLFHGAHFVYINVAEDGGTGMSKSFDQVFNNYFSGDQTSSCPGNSHYGGAYGTDDYYLEVGDDVPNDPSFILALLVGDTSWGDTSNGFMQLEGWQAQAGEGMYGGPRHHHDYKTFNATVWNISTFGACAYSEKRCTTVFLAQDTFRTDIAADTHMPHYEGAGSIQDWMAPGYITGGALDDFVIDVHDNIGDLYFFQGTKIIHYKSNDRKMHDNYPQPIENIFPGLASMGFDRIDAVYSVPSAAHTDGGTYYFFKGGQYLHYTPGKSPNLSRHNIVPNSGTEKWPGLASLGFTTIDAAAYQVSSDGKSDKIHFFRGSDYARFDVKSNMIDHHATLSGPPNAPAAITAGGAEFVSGELLVLTDDEAVYFDTNTFEIDWEWGAAAIYGTNVFPGLWWG